MTDMTPGLADFGWSHHFNAQRDPEAADGLLPARVVAVHRDALEVAGPAATGRVAQVADPGDEEGLATVGDFVLVDPATGRARRVLVRKSLFKRKAAGTGRRVQLVAANVDTLFVVTSCNQDFNVARIERYLALAREANVTPVVLLTKADLVDDPADYEHAAARIMPGLFVECLDGRDADAAARLAPWCGTGQTVALLGSSGVGKSTLVNTLAGGAQAVAGIREDDGHGRHTTTGRSMHRLASGGWLIDTPGMRELQLADVEDGIAAVFSDIASLAAGCRFADCRHAGEPGCAIEAAVASGALGAGRLGRYRKLLAEDARNSASIHERRQRERGFGKVVREATRLKNRRWDP
jgi:ribosome biogenesis GTPase